MIDDALTSADLSRGNRYCDYCSYCVTSFPGSPHARMKNQKKGESLIKFYHVRNIISREKLITCGWMNELAHALLTEYTGSVVWKLYGWHNETAQHYVTLPGSTAIYGECTQTCTFENHDKLTQRMTFKALWNAKAALWLSLFCTYCLNKTTRTKSH